MKPLYTKEEAQKKKKANVARQADCRREISAHRTHIENNKERIEELVRRICLKETRIVIVKPVNPKLTMIYEGHILNNRSRIDELNRRNDGNRNRIAELQREIKSLQSAARDIEKWAKEWS